MKFTDDEVLEMAEILDSITDADIVRVGRVGRKKKAVQVYMAKHPGCRQFEALALINEACKQPGDYLK